MCKIQAEETNLKQVVDVYNNTILNLQEELKNHHILIPELQNKIIVSVKILVYLCIFFIIFLVGTY